MTRSAPAARATPHTPGARRPSVASQASARNRTRRERRAGTNSCDTLAGLYCSTGATPVCTALGLPKAGEPCGLVNGALAVCAGGGHCSLNIGTGMGTCEAAAADGAACDDTNGPTCLSPAVCGATSKVCTLPNPANCH